MNPTIQRRLACLASLRSPLGRSCQKRLSSGQTEKPKATFTTPTPPPKPEVKLGMMEKFQKSLMKEAEELEQARQDPEGEKGNFLTRMDAKIQKQRAELEERERLRQEAGQTTRLAPKFQQRMNEYLDYETNTKERERLLHQAFHEGYWDDQKGSVKLARKGIKHWEAPSSLVASQKALVIPRVIGTSLSGKEINLHEALKKSSVNFVTFAFSGLAESQINSYLVPFRKEFGDNDKVQIFQVMIEENWAKAWAFKLFVPWTRFRTREADRDNYLYYAGEFSAMRRAAGMTNKLLGWVNLVDANGRIRWQAHGPATEGEKEFMGVGVSQILAERPPVPKILQKHMKKAT
ncbi:Mitochondrial ATPase complex subunit atp10 [Dinochytrium kinnereticum]|nr:Mitochondrial ATPase complex subunit atp10 [Dinochytrium kinnereticum]